MEPGVSRDVKLAASEAFAWTVWTEVMALLVMFLVRPVLAPYLFGVDFMRETLIIVVLCGAPIFCAFWMEGLLKALDRLA